MNELVLIHHGIKGQKCGVRRYQNEDGSLTAAGRKQYDKNLGEKSTRRITTGKHSRANDRYNMWRMKTNPYSSLRYSL